MPRRLLAISLAILPLSLWGNALGSESEAIAASADSTAPHESGSQDQQSTQPATLAEAWLAWQERRHAEGQAPLDWAYSFALRQEDAAEASSHQARLVAELRILGERLAIEGELEPAAGLNAWATAIQAASSAPLRSPEPLGLPRLAADLRRNPSMAEIVHLGYCAPPSWLEAWTLSGVQRLPWHPGMQLDEALAMLPDEALTGVAHARLIDPTGETHRLGIAAWNHQPAPLPPGSRLLAELPDQLAAQPATVKLINDRLSRYLARQLPGEECEVQESRIHGAEGSRNE